MTPVDVVRKRKKPQMNKEENTKILKTKNMHKEHYCFRDLGQFNSVLVPPREKKSSTELNSMELKIRSNNLFIVANNQNVNVDEEFSSTFHTRGRINCDDIFIVST